MVTIKQDWTRHKTKIGFATWNSKNSNEKNKRVHGYNDYKNNDFYLYAIN